MENLTENQKLEDILLRLGRMEQMSMVLADAEKTKLTVLQQLQQKIAALEHNALAQRIFDGLEATSKMYPKKKTVVFVGREYFGDNIKYAYLACVAQAKSEGFTCTYLPNDEAQYQMLSRAGLPCLPAALADWKVEHMRVMLEAQTAVMCALFYPYDERSHLFCSLLAGAKKVQLWHGIPLKEIGMECLYTPATFSERTAGMLAASGMFDSFIGTSNAMKPEWEKRFAFRDYAAIGYPRNDVLFRELTAQDRINLDDKAYAMAEEAARAGKPVILYTPTFRDHNLGIWFNTVGIERFAEYCLTRGYTFLVNLHPFEHEYLAYIQPNYPNITFVRPKTDIYPILKHASLLITDYSSLVFDFLLLDRPVVFFRPDHADYIAHARGLISNHEQYTCGKAVGNINDLKAAVEWALKNDPERDARAALKQRLYDHCDGEAGKRLVEAVMR